LTWLKKKKENDSNISIDTIFITASVIENNEELLVIKLVDKFINRTPKK
jgi:hypothetical protein